MSGIRTDKFHNKTTKNPTFAISPVPPMSFDREWGSNRFQNQDSQAGKQKTTIFDDSFLIRHVGRLTRLLMAPGVGIEPTTN